MDEKGACTSAYRHKKMALPLGSGPGRVGREGVHVISTH